MLCILSVDLYLSYLLLGVTSYNAVIDYFYCYISYSYFNLRVYNFFTVIVFCFFNFVGDF